MHFRENQIRHWRRYVLICVIGFFIYGSALVALARAAEDRLPNLPAIHTMVNIARQAMPNACAPVTMTVSDFMANTGAMAESLYVPGFPVLYNNGNCQTRLSSDAFVNSYRTDQCTALVHEFGLLSGLPEIDNGVMSQTLYGEWPACRKVFGSPASLMDVRERIHEYKPWYSWHRHNRKIRHHMWRLIHLERVYLHQIAAGDRITY